jgi:hypothetical protein
MATCGGNSAVRSCPRPASGSDQDDMLQRAETTAGFDVLYPCFLPQTQNLSSTSVIGEAGRRQAELVFDGPYDLTIRQAQFPPAVSPDPAGASRITIDLFPNVKAMLIEVNDGTGEALYHLFWERQGIYYELQAYGPPLQRRAILNVATSLE